jgi:hypothetical protein
MRFVLMHELAHIRRRDIAIMWIVRVIGALHWFNPLLWIAGMKVRAEQELACDARVLALTDRGEWNDYGRLLVEMLSRAIGPTARSGSMGMIGTGTSMRRRIIAITQPTKPRWYMSLLAILLMLAIGGTTLTGPAVHAAEPTTQSKPSSTAELATCSQVYEVRDIINQSDFIEMPGMGIMVPATTAPSAKYGLLQDIVDTIERRVDPDSWQDHGGSIGTITVRANDQLEIIQTFANQMAIANLLAGLHKRKFPKIEVDSYVICGPEVFRLLEREPGQWNDDHGTGVWSAALSEQQVSGLREQSKSDINLVYPRLTMFNRQRCYAVVSTESAYVKKLTREADGKFAPEVGIVQRGVMEDCRTTVSGDGHSIMVDFRPQVSRLLAMNQVLAPDAPNSKGPFYQVPTISKATCDQTLTIADDHAIALRLVPKIMKGDQPIGDDTPLLLLIHAKIITANTPADATPPPTTQEMMQSIHHLTPH